MTPVIFGLSGRKLTPDEKAFLREADPAGVILFSRNIEDPDQVRGLTDSIRQVLGRDLLVLIDQEGGRVQRLGPPHWRAAQPMAVFGKAFEKKPEQAERALYFKCRLLAAELSELGINVDCLPVLDVPAEGANEIIGDRAFSPDPEITAALGKVAYQGLMEGGVLPVIKHIPGHGRATLDSHRGLPVVDTPFKELGKTDFLPFRANRDAPFAMTAHVTFSALDPENPATLSKTVIRDVIRKNIGFEGHLISDDITMKALSGTPKQITEKCLAAGIDLVLHCSGEFPEMEGVMTGVGAMPKGKVEKISRHLSSLKPGPEEQGQLLAEYKPLEKEMSG